MTRDKILEKVKAEFEGNGELICKIDDPAGVSTLSDFVKISFHTLAVYINSSGRWMLFDEDYIPDPSLDDIILRIRMKVAEDAMEAL